MKRMNSLGSRTNTTPAVGNVSPEYTPLDKEIKNITDRMRECDEEQENQDN